MTTLYHLSKAPFKQALYSTNLTYVFHVSVHPGDISVTVALVILAGLTSVSLSTVILTDRDTQAILSAV